MKIVALLILISMCGCAAYKQSPWTPDSFNYTVSRDRNTGEQVDYFGLSWSLK